MNVSARDLLKPRVHLEQWAWQLNRGLFFFQSREMIPSKTTGGMKPGSVPRRRRHKGGGKRSINRPGIIPPQLVETLPVTSNRKEGEYQMLDNGWISYWSRAEGESFGKKRAVTVVITSEPAAQVCLQVCVYAKKLTRSTLENIQVQALF